MHVNLFLETLHELHDLTKHDIRHLGP
jgi:hypothetical protein